MSSRTQELHAAPNAINVFVVIDRQLASMAVVESRGPIHSTMGTDLPDSGEEVLVEGERWSLTQAPVPAAASDALVVLASNAAHRASLLPAGPARRILCRQGALLSLLAAGLDGAP